MLPHQSYSRQTEQTRPSQSNARRNLTIAGFVLLFYGALVAGNYRNGNIAYSSMDQSSRQTAVSADLEAWSQLGLIRQTFALGYYFAAQNASIPSQPEELTKELPNEIYLTRARTDSYGDSFR